MKNFLNFFYYETLNILRSFSSNLIKLKETCANLSKEKENTWQSWELPRSLSVVKWDSRQQQKPTHPASHFMPRVHNSTCHIFIGWSRHFPPIGPNSIYTLHFLLLLKFRLPNFWTSPEIFPRLTPITDAGNEYVAPDRDIPILVFAQSDSISICSFQHRSGIRMVQSRRG